MESTQSVLTRKGQVTVPATIRRHLGLRRGDRVEFRRAGDEIRLVKGKDAVSQTAGVFKVHRPALSPEAERRLVEHLIAEDVLRRSGD